jgi:hypothetical protein
MALKYEPHMVSLNFLVNLSYQLQFYSAAETALATKCHDLTVLFIESEKSFIGIGMKRQNRKKKLLRNHK